MRFSFLFISWATLLFLASTTPAAAQCTTEAGTLQPEAIMGCFPDHVAVPSWDDDAVLESDDAVKFILHDGSPDEIGDNYQFTNINAWYIEPPAFVEIGAVYQIAVIAGNADGVGGVELDDPCLSISGGATVTWNESPTLNLPDIELGCDEYEQELFLDIAPPGDYEFMMRGFQVPMQPIEQTVIFTAPNLSVELYATNLLNGCSVSDTITVSAAPGKPVVEIVTTGESSCGALSVVAGVADGVTPLAYEWSDGSTTPENTLAPGTHCVSVTAGNDCVAKDCIVVPEPADLQVALSFNQNDDCEQSYLEAQATGAAGNLTYQWSSGGSDEPENYDFEVGDNYVTVTDASGCQAIASIFVDEAPSLCGNLQLQLFGDFNNDCLLNGDDVLLPNFKATLTDENGVERLITTLATFNTFNWSRRLNPGQYTLTVQPPNDLWSACSPTQTFTLSAGELTTVPVPLQPNELCHDLSVDVSAGELTWCAPDNWVSLRYENFGTQPGEEAYIDLQLEEFLTITSTQASYLNLGNNLYRFNLGTVGIGERGNIQLRIAIDCDATFGATHCLEAEIAPNSPCTMLSGWSGASVDIVDAVCESDSLKFIVENVGTADMTVDLEYVIIEDAVMFFSTPPTLPPLSPGEQHEIGVPANGATWRLETNQEPEHPGMNVPSKSVEGCDTYGSLGFVNQFPQNDADPFVDIECIQNTGSYDPNDKQGFPLGLGNDRIIAPGEGIEYRIRFQNTGTDTAETVVIRDTLSELLDPLTLQAGASSHDYRLEAYGSGMRYLAFIFENINLLDSNLNEPASHGYVDFKIQPREGLPLGTDIFNSAAIYFDYNPPIYTNTTRHRIDSLFVTALTWEAPPQYELRIFPNPVAHTAQVRLEGIAEHEVVTLQLFNAQGQLIWSKAQPNGQAVIARRHLPSGLYFIQALSGGQKIGSGKIMIK